VALYSAAAAAADNYIQFSAGGDLSQQPQQQQLMYARRVLPSRASLLHTIIDTLTLNSTTS